MSYRQRRSKSSPLVGAAVRASLDAIANGGRAVGTITEGPETLVGKRCFVPFGAPGDRIAGAVLEDLPRYSVVELLEVLEPSPNRVEPECRHFGVCGGCDLQHLSLTAQREEKRKGVLGTLERIGTIRLPGGLEIRGTELPGYGSRSRAVFQVKNGSAGFYEAGSRNIVEIRECPILEPGLFRAFEQVRTALADSIDSTSRIVVERTEQGTGVTVHAGPGDEIEPAILLTDLVRSAAVVTPDGSRREAAGSEASPAMGHFAQGNQFANEVLRGVVRELVPDGPLTEFFAGAGNFSFELAAATRPVRAVELDPVLVSAGRARAVKHGLEGLVSFIESDSASYAAAEPVSPSVLLDPPRSGARETVEFLAARPVRSIVYVSCDPGTLARDVAVLAEAGFACDRGAVVDMFPHTGHVETVLLLTRS